MTVETDWPREVEAYLRVLERGDRLAALRQVRGLRLGGHDVLSLVQQLLAPAQLRVGELWLRDSWSVGQEHAATAVSETIIEWLAAERERQTLTDAQATEVVVSCVEQEWHALPALMVAEHLRAEGFAVSYLGANRSTSGLVRQIQDSGPSAVLLSCSLSAFLPLARRQIEAVRDTGTPVVVGGAAFDPDGRRAATLGATGFATSVVGLADLVRSLPTAVRSAPPLTHHGAEEALVLLGQRESLADRVEQHLLASLDLAGTDDLTRGDGWFRVLSEQLPLLVGSVAGALVCDDPQIVVHALSWAQEVLTARSAPVAARPALEAGLLDALHDLPEASRLLLDL